MVSTRDRIRTIGFASMALLMILPGPATAYAEGEEIPFDDERWEVSAGELVDHLGRSALRGAATLKNVQLGNGVIDVDLAVDGRRGFPGIKFRMQDEQNAEIFYIRPHRSRSYSHALQYTPVFNAMTGWQLYSGRGFTAAADIPWEEWIHVRIKLEGARARIYFNDMDRPAIAVDRLVRGAAAGGIALTGQPGGQVHWANFRLTQGGDFNFGPAPIRAPAEKMIRSWEISQSFPLAALDRTLPPEALDLGEIEWSAVTPEPSGLVNISRHMAMRGRTPECIYARTVIETEQATRKMLEFGYSDEVTIFLNRKPVFTGESSFRSRDSEFMGVIGLNDALFLDLEEGKNELIFAVAEGFGGWGFLARLDDVRGGPVAMGDGINHAWGSTEGWQLPESVLVDSKRGVAYISNMGPGGQGEAGYVAKVRFDGTVEKLRWADGLRAPTGMALAGDRLLVVERSGLAVVDTASGEVSERHAFDQGAFLNDVAVDALGTAYVTDSRAGVIYEVKNGEWREWLRHDAFDGVNGISVEGDKLVVGTLNSGSLITIDRESRRVEKIIDLAPSRCDGVIAVGEGRHLVTDFAGRLLLVEPSGSFSVLVDTSAAAVACADFGYAEKERLVIIPSLFGNTVTAFDLGGVFSDED